MFYYYHHCHHYLLLLFPAFFPLWHTKKTKKQDTFCKSIQPLKVKIIIIIIVVVNIGGGGIHRHPLDISGNYQKISDNRVCFHSIKRENTALLFIHTYMYPKSACMHVRATFSMHMLKVANALENKKYFLKAVCCCTYLDI